MSDQAVLVVLSLGASATVAGSVMYLTKPSYKSLLGVILGVMTLVMSLVLSWYLGGGYIPGVEFKPLEELRFFVEETRREK